MKIIFMTLLILSSIFAKDNKTELEKYMDFNTSYYTVQEYKKKFAKKFIDADNVSAIKSKDLRLLTKKKVAKKDYYAHNRIHLSKRYTNILKALKDLKYIKYMKLKDKTSKIGVVVYNNKKALIMYLGGDRYSISNSNYFIKLHKNRLDIYELDACVADIAPPRPTNLK